MANKKNQKTSAFKTRIFKANIEVGNGTVTIEFPKAILEYIHSSGKSIFWSPVNGVIQISGEKPHMVIPMISVNEDSFVPHETLPVVEAEE
jgi:hypothetical protein